MGVHIKAGNPRWLIETEPSGGSLPPSTKQEGAAHRAKEAGRRPPKAQQGLLIITLIALLTKTVMSWARRGYPQPGGGTHPPISRGGVLGEVLSY